MAKIKGWKIKRKNKYGTLYVSDKGSFLDVRKMFEHSGYNPRSLWYVFLPGNSSDFAADFVYTTRVLAENKAKEYMRANPNG
jgi:hypothetical protein